jgi:hypothetical protein
MAVSLRRTLFGLALVAFATTSVALPDLEPDGSQAATAGVLGARTELLTCDRPGARTISSVAHVPFAESSPFESRIPRGARVDARSAAMVAGVAAVARERGFVVSMKSWTVSLYSATRSTPRYDVPLVGPWAPPGSVLKGVPIPRTAQPDPKEDGHLAVLDPLTGCEYDMWGAQRLADGRWVAKWGRRLSLFGSGVDPEGKSARAAGFALRAGLIFPQELVTGRIEHALVFNYPHTRTGGPVPPATSSDGRSTRPDAIPEGARLQLDPSLDLSKLRLTKVERAIARALQVYGMYLADTGGAVGLYAVHPHSYAHNPYPGPVPEYLPLSIPVERLRVLQLPAGS